MLTLELGQLYVFQGTYYEVKEGKYGPQLFKLNQETLIKYIQEGKIDVSSRSPT